MIGNQNVAKVIFDAVDELNQLLPAEQRLEKSLDAALVGNSGKLDSLGLVNLIVVTEQRIENEFGLKITLTDERAMLQEKSPFETIGTFSDYIAMRLDEVKNGKQRI